MESSISRQPGSFGDFITVREVAGLLGTSYQAAYSLAASGRLGEPIRCGRHYFYPRQLALDAVRKRREQRKRNAFAPIREEN
jgi:hypothetical protein